MRATATPIMPATGNRNDNGLSNNRSGRGREGEIMARSRLNSQTIRKISLFPSPSFHGYRLSGGGGIPFFFSSFDGTMEGARGKLL